MPTTRRTKGAVLAPARDDPMPRKPRSRATSVASSQRSNDDRLIHHHHHSTPSAPAIVSRLASHNEELLAENEDLRQELEKQKSKRRTLRDKQLAEQLAEYNARHSHESDGAQTHNEQNRDSKPTEADNSPRKQQQQQKQTQKIPTRAAADDNDDSNNYNDSQALVQQTSTPGPTRTTKIPLAASTPETPATVPKWRQFLSAIGGFSPFPSRRPATPRTEREPEHVQALSPLGDLPQNRKRSAPESESDTATNSKKPRTPDSAPEPVLSQPREQEPQEPQPQHQSESDKQPNATVHQTRAQSARNALLTPTRAPKRAAPQTERPARSTQQDRQEVMAPDTTPRRRTIRDVRAAKFAARTAPLASGLRRSEPPSKPKEPNADKRLARMQELERLMAEKKRMEEQIARLAAEQEADGIDTRRRKRVKVDELIYIPHNDPGDAAGTFKVPDWDSDDEMEVDEEVPIRQNLFSLNAEKQSTATQPAPPISDTPAQQHNKPIQVSTTPATKSGPVFSSTITKPAAGSALLPPATLFSQPLPASKLAQSITPDDPVPEAAVTKPASQAENRKPSASAVKPSSKTFSWPSIATRQSGDIWPQPNKLAAGQKFGAAFNAWLVVA